MLKSVSVLLTAVFVFGQLHPLHADTTQTRLQLTAPTGEVERISQHFNQTRQELQKLAPNHPDVLDQFDRFADGLKKAYSQGEGFIEKDIHAITNAISFAADKHRHQTRKSAQNTPYIIHPIGVADHLLTIGHVRDPDILIGALLHDTVEDTNTSFDEIRDNFGPGVESFVREVTDDKNLPKAERKRLQIVDAPKKSAGAAQIKLGDKYYNLKDLSSNPPPDWDVARIDEYFLWAEQVVSRLPWVNRPLKESVNEVLSTYWEKKTK